MFNLNGLAAIFGGLAVAAGAFGAHALSNLVTTQRLDTWDTASTYLLFHALAALVSASVSPSAQRLFLVGSVLFSGSLFAFVLTEFRPLVFVTPLGGVVLLSAWATLAVAYGRRH